MFSKIAELIVDRAGKQAYQGVQAEGRYADGTPGTFPAIVEVFDGRTIDLRRGGGFVKANATPEEAERWLTEGKTQ